MKYFLLILILFCSSISYGQQITNTKRVRLETANDSIRVIMNGIEVNLPNKLSEVDPSFVYVAMRKGYVNEGFTFSELAKKGKAFIK